VIPASVSSPTSGFPAEHLGLGWGGEGGRHIVKHNSSMLLWDIPELPMQRLHNAGKIIHLHVTLALFAD
jgi:hypothetical protein